MDTLTEESLDWSFTHILKFGDTDIFPVPFEYELIKPNWTNLKNKLKQINISNYENRTDLKMLVPKPDKCFRVAIQLDPIDSIIYLALVYEVANLLEDNRTVKDARIACSYRLDINSKGQFFSSVNGWNDFDDRSRELADSGQYHYVVNADIADFYNQINHHRVRNALECANVSASRAKNIGS